MKTEKIIQRMREVQDDMTMQILMGHAPGTVTGPNGNPERNITAESTLVKNE